MPQIASLRWLADHADRAYPIVIARAKATPTPWLVEVVGRLARPEATTWPGELLRAAGPASGAAEVRSGARPIPERGVCWWRRSPDPDVRKLATQLAP